MQNPVESARHSNNQTWVQRSIRVGIRWTNSISLARQHMISHYRGKKKKKKSKRIDEKKDTPKIRAKKVRATLACLYFSSYC